MRVASQPVPVSAVFYQYGALWSLVRDNYLQWRVMSAIFTGRTIKAMPTLQYPATTMNDQRPSIRQSWHYLTAIWRNQESSIQQ